MWTRLDKEIGSNVKTKEVNTASDIKIDKAKQAKLTEFKFVRKLSTVTESFWSLLRMTESKIFFAALMVHIGLKDSLNEIVRLRLKSFSFAI